MDTYRLYRISSKSACYGIVCKNNLVHKTAPIANNINGAKSIGQKWLDIRKEIELDSRNQIELVSKWVE